jgi:hypothetical protein
MVLKKIDLETTHLTLEELLAKLDINTEVLLTKGVARVAQAGSAVMTRKRILGLHEGKGWISDDFTG